MKKKFLQLTKMMSKLIIYGLTLQILFIGLLSASGNAQGVKSIREVYIDLVMDDVNLEEVFNRIERVSDFRFTYDIKDVKSIRISLKKPGSSLYEVLEDISRQGRLHFRQINYDIDVKKITPKSEGQAPVEIIIQNRNITGKVTSQEDDEGLPGVNVVERGTTNGTITDLEGTYSLDVQQNAVLVFSSVGFHTVEVETGNQTVINLQMEQDVKQLEEIVVVGYGVQKRSDITGTVSSLPQDRLEMTPNTNVAQAIQGAIPGIMVRTSRTGAQSDQTIMVRGRNSIKANNDPLIILDGIPYGGSINDVNPNDVQSIEILKDASASAIYGSRGSNGVILITTKGGSEGKAKFSYEGKYALTDITKVHELLTGPEFYDFKITRNPSAMTQSEKQIYEDGTWVNWPELAMRTGKTQEHNFSISGGLKDTKYYIGLGYLDIKGVAKNDDFSRLSSRINLETKIVDWISIGTRTHVAFNDASGAEANFDFVRTNPLSKAYDEDGNLTIHPWPENIVLGNLLGPLLYDDLDKSYQVMSNNFAVVDFPFVKGLSYRLNTGLRYRFMDRAQYRGRDTQSGSEALGRASISNSVNNSTVIENILSYNRDFGRHTVFATALYSYEGYNGKTNSLAARQFANDFFSWYAASDALIKEPSQSFSETNLVSQMARVNYSYASKYLLTLTVRRDGYSGFGDQTKWGTFPSVAIGWNLANEDFFPMKDLINVLKFRASYGLNGNQAIGAYESISRLTSANIHAGSEAQIGYKPSKLGADNLGWESSKTFNLGFDYELFEGRISGDLNWYRTNTYDLLLDRSISPIHGIKMITQNIGETQNNGLEMVLNSRNIAMDNFQWSTTGILSYNKNKILSLYGLLDEHGNEIDDIDNQWFIGKPIKVNYDFIWEGTWQENEADEATQYGTQPGYVKLKDFDGNGLTADDKRVIGQEDPKLLWGLTNTFSYSNFTLSVFIHGVHGATVRNFLMNDHVQGAEVRYNTLRKNWWTPDNPTNDWIINKELADRMGGFEGHIYEKSDYVRIKDISLAYDLPQGLIGKIGLNRVRVYATGRNLITYTQFSGLDPEFTDESSQKYIPMQKEYVFGLSLGF